MRHLLISITLLLIPFVSICPQETKQTSESEMITERLIQMEREKDTAFQRGDKPALDLIYADDYQAITANGTTIMKKALLDSLPEPISLNYTDRKMSWSAYSAMSRL